MGDDLQKGANSAILWFKCLFLSNKLLNNMEFCYAGRYSGRYPVG